MRICDRCGSKKAVQDVKKISATTEGTEFYLMADGFPRDICKSCLDLLREVVMNFLLSIQKEG